jgi:error-prone DNA polymerase
MRHRALRLGCTLEASRSSRLAVRLGLRMMRGLNNADAALLVAHRGAEP